MKSTVIVRANQGLPVDVTAIDPVTGDGGNVTRVERNTERTFHVHGGQDLTIHEVSPLEEAAEPTSSSFARTQMAGSHAW